MDCILLIDDDKINNYLNYLTIKKLDIAEMIVMLPNGREALDLLKDTRSKEKKLPELILLDMYMPEMDGFEFIKEFRNLNFKDEGNIHIVVLTNSIDPGDIKKMKELGITQFIDKPLSAEKLMNVLKDIPKSKGAN